MMLHDLPWLSAPSQADRDGLRLAGLQDADALTRLAALARLRWNSAELGAIGRKLRKLERDGGGDWAQTCRSAGLVPVSLLIISSNTMAPLLDALVATALTRGLLLTCHVVEYQEPEAWLLENQNELPAVDLTLLALDQVSLRLEAGIGDAAGAAAVVEAAIARLSAVCESLAAKTGAPVIVQNIVAPADAPQASIDAWLPGSPRSLVMDFNRRLAALAREKAHILFDATGIADLMGRDAWDAGRYWYTARLNFSPLAVPLYAHRLVTLIAAQRGKSRRVLVLDLDNTVWGGVIGDDGIEGIVLGGTSALGSAHIALQKMALHYKARGIVLCIASKNTREIALDAFRRHPEMLLREDDVTLFEINWENKAASIRAMAATLNLGLEAFVFVDDNPAERKQVRDVLAEVAVPELPEDPSAWLPVIQAAAYFEQVGFSDEDLKRSDYYKGNAQRAAMQGAAGGEGEFLQSLQMVMTVTPFDGLGRKRIAQLIAKSNQFNLTTRRYSETQIEALERDAATRTLQVRLTDIFGDNGMISVVICRKGAEAWEVDTWLMSCRVLGRQVERAVLNIIAAEALAAGATKLRGDYIPTAKNGIVADHYAKLGFTKETEAPHGQTGWVLELASFVPCPVPMQVVLAD
jgi:FkbH-like protein